MSGQEDRLTKGLLPLLLEAAQLTAESSSKCASRAEEDAEEEANEEEEKRPLSTLLRESLPAKDDEL